MRFATLSCAGPNRRRSASRGGLITVAGLPGGRKARRRETSGEGGIRTLGTLWVHTLSRRAPSATRAPLRQKPRSQKSGTCASGSRQLRSRDSRLVSARAAPDRLHHDGEDPPLVGSGFRSRALACRLSGIVAFAPCRVRRCSLPWPPC